MVTLDSLPRRPAGALHSLLPVPHRQPKVTKMNPNDSPAGAKLAARYDLTPEERSRLHRENVARLVLYAATQKLQPTKQPRREWQPWQR